MTLLNKYIDIAIEEAKKSVQDIPIGAVIVKNDKVISAKHNNREKINSTTAHAEILAIEEANKKLNSWRLDDCDIYITLEPCPMCAWAIINARISNVYFGSYDSQYGAFLSALNLAKLANSKVNVIGGIKEQECDKLLKEYFRILRNEKNT